MIEYIGRSGPPEAMNCPAFICDACRKQVVNDGNVQWASRWVGDERQSSPLFVSHKYPCSRRLDALLDRRYPRTDGWLFLWEEADVFISHLTGNLTNAFADDSEGEYHRHTLIPRTTL